MGVIRQTYNFIMTLIGLAIIGGVAFLFFAAKWAEYEEEKYYEDREDIAAEVAEAARERGLGDIDELRREYLAQCPVDEASVLEGDAGEICAAMTDALLAQSQKRQMTLSDFGELKFELCALVARQEGEDPEDYCDGDRQYAIDGVLVDALALGACDFERARVVEPVFEYSIAKRGRVVYVDQDRHVDCADGTFKEWDYEGFFEGKYDDDDEAPQLRRFYTLLDEEDYDAAQSLLEGHKFGEDEDTDFWMLVLVLEDRSLALLPEVLKRNGSKVNFEINYYDQPLARAIDNDSSEAALALLDAGADPTRPYEYGQTPIALAAGKGMLDVVQALVAKGADVNGVVGSESLSFAEPLMLAANSGHEDVALWLLDNGASVQPEDPSRIRNWSPDLLLEYAAEGGSLDVVERIVGMGARSDDTLRVIESAISGGSADVLALLFDTGYEMPGVKQHDRLYDDVVDVIQEEGRGRIEEGIRMFEMLLERDLDMSEMSKSGWNYGHQAVIHYAPPTIRMDRDDERAAFVDEQRLVFVKRVIDEVLAAGIDIDQRYESQTMLMEAADGGQAELVRYLLDKGADASLRNEDGELALDVAVREGRRLTSFWDENEALKRRFAEVVEILGGSPAMLDAA